MEAPDAEAIAAAEAPVTSTDVAPPPAASSDVGEPAAPAEETPAAAEGTPASGAQALRAPQASVEPDTQAMELQPALPPSRTIDPTVIAPPEHAAGEELLREAPREPLSQLSLALPPPPEFSNPWAGKPLFRPVALGSAVFESGGTRSPYQAWRRRSRQAALAKARLAMRRQGAHAFRFLAAPLSARSWAEQDKEVMRASCRLAKQDVGAWLVSNGWALAAPGGYVQAEETARAAVMGTFGAPPDTSSVADVPDAPASALADVCRS